MRARDHTSAHNRRIGLRIISITAVALARRDVREALVPAEVDERVQEAEDRFPGAEERVVQERDD